MNIVVFPFVDFKKCEIEGFRTRDVHLIKHLARHPSVDKILVIDRPISVTEAVVRRRPLRVRNGDVIWRRPGVWLSSYCEKTYVLDIAVPHLIAPVLRGRSWWLDAFSNARVQRTISRAMTFLQMENPAIHMFSPLAYPVVGRLGEEKTVFHSVDNWLEHPQFKKARTELQEAYRVLNDKTAIVIATAPALRELFPNHPSVTVVENGVDIETFRGKPFFAPDDIKPLTRPVVGYAGKIQERIDVELVNYLARELPSVTFVFIGQVLSLNVLRELKAPNIHYLGDKHYDVLPDYLASFDAAIIPHNVGRFTDSMSPLKIYEYLAANLRVVSTPVAGVKGISSWVEIEESKQGFKRAIERVLNLPRGEFDLPEEWTWSERAKRIADVTIKGSHDFG